MKKIVLAAITTLTLATTASAWQTTIRTIGNSTYIDSYSSSGGYSSTVCRYIGTTIYCN